MFHIIRTNHNVNDDSLNSDLKFSDLMGSESNCVSFGAITKGSFAWNLYYKLIVVFDLS